MPTISHTDLDVHALCLGGNVFGWTADEAASHAVLDAYAAAGGDFVDTADWGHLPAPRAGGLRLARPGRAAGPVGGDPR
jgi:hypothetical protein